MLRLREVCAFELRRMVVVPRKWKVLLVSDPPIPVASGDHVVQFYKSDDELSERTGRHLAGALHAGARGVVIATPEHSLGFEAWISATGVDLAAAVAETRYVALDARTTLERFLVNGMPDARAFDRVVGEVVRSAAATGRQVCAYGEMVALLWDEGRVIAAIELESLWNDLSARVPFSLNCSYPSSSVMGEDQAELLSQVCCLHTAVVGVDPQRRSTRAFAASPDAPRAARRFVVETLEGLGCTNCVADAQLVVSELVTNAVVHAQTDLTVALALSSDAIRIEVRDRNRTPPMARSPAAFSMSGRGLPLIDAVTSAWGVNQFGDGKVVWAQLAS
jgi:anti-sigma regulatory factor (Ser/Thr protein kinase)